VFDRGSRLEFDVSYNSDQGLFLYEGSPDLPHEVAVWLNNQLERKYSVKDQVQYRYAPSGAAGTWIADTATQQVLDAAEEEATIPPGPEGEAEYEHEEEYGEQIKAADRIVTNVYLPLQFALKIMGEIKQRHWNDVKNYLDKGVGEMEMVDYGTGFIEKESGNFVSPDDPKVRPLRMNALIVQSEIRCFEEKKTIKGTLHGPTIGDIRRGKRISKRTWNKSWNEMEERLPALADSDEESVWIYVETRFREYAGWWPAKREAERWGS